MLIHLDTEILLEGCPESDHSARYVGEVKSCINAIRRTLTKHGWTLGKTLGRYYPFGAPQRILEGINVSRVGCSDSVAIVYRSVGNDARYVNCKIQEAIALLRSNGFMFDDRGWLECSTADRRSRARMAQQQ